MWNRIQSLIQYRPKTVLFFIFILTVFIRLPQLTRPLSKHHELNAASLLITLQVWNEQGLAPSKAAPVQFFPGTYNTFNDRGNKFKNLNSSGAYLSMGAGAYLLPWLAMKLFHVPPSPASLRVWALLVELITVYILYGLLGFFKRNYFREHKNLALTGCLFFLTAPVVLWFMGNSYNHETMVLLFYLLVLKNGFAIRQNDYKWNAKRFHSYGLCVALAVYIDWLGAIAAFAFFVQAISIKKIKTHIPFLVINACAVALPIAIIFWQYISLVEWQEYQGFIVAQFNRRSLPGSEVRYSLIDFIKYFATGYGILCIAALLGIAMLRRWNNYLIMLAAIPLLHYLVFRGFSNEHDYAVLKWSPFLIVTAVAGISELSRFWQKIALIVIVVSSVFLYYFVNPPFAKSLNGERYAWMKEAGQQIAATAKADEYIFINTEGYLHQVAWYAHRNYKPVKDTTEARIWLQQQPGSKAVFFKLNEQQQIVEIIKMKR